MKQKSHGVFLTTENDTVSSLPLNDVAKAVCVMNRFRNSNETPILYWFTEKLHGDTEDSDQSQPTVHGPESARDLFILKLEEGETINDCDDAKHSRHLHFFLKPTTEGWHFQWKFPTEKKPGHAKIMGKIVGDAVEWEDESCVPPNIKLLLVGITRYLRQASQGAPPTD